ncbi:MAG: hypothetical protein IIA27_10815, partial [Gemmatimonadetes bacterium]|nr:hypothetical protein [Gemmatimonadota bacterium]
VNAVEGITLGITKEQWFDSAYATEAAAIAVSKLILAFRPKGRAQPPDYIKETPEVFADKIALGILDGLKSAREPPVPMKGKLYSDQSTMYPVLRQYLGELMGRL